MAFTPFTTEAYISLAFSLIFCLALPITALIVWKKKNKDLKVMLPAIIGALGFFLFAMILEQILHIVMLPLVQDSKVLYVIYGCLAAGVFEETSRFLALKFVLKKHIADGDPRHAISYGIGHGGIEAMLLISLNSITFLSFGILISLGMGELILTGVPEEQIPLAMSQVNAVAEQSFGSSLLGCFERVVAMTAHICFTIIVYYGVTMKKVIFFPLAILCHALVDVAAALYQVGVITELYVLEIIAAAAAVVLVFAASVLYKKMKKEYNGNITAVTE